MATLFSEDWSGAGNGATVTSATSTFETITGSGTAVHSTEQTFINPRSAKVTGTTTGNRILEKDLTSQTNEYGMIYLYKVGTPLTNFFFCEVDNGASSAVAAQLRLKTDGTLGYRDAAIEQGTPFAMPDGWSYIFIDLLGAGNATVVAHVAATGSTIGTMSGLALTATNFSDVKLGCMTSLAGGAFTIYYGYTEWSNSGRPTPLAAPPPPPPDPTTGEGGNLRWARKVGSLLVPVRWAVKD